MFNVSEILEKQNAEEIEMLNAFGYAMMGLGAEPTLGGIAVSLPTVRRVLSFRKDGEFANLNFK
jgi:hypothetical protein